VTKEVIIDFMLVMHAIGPIMDAIILIAGNVTFVAWLKVKIAHYRTFLTQSSQREETIELQEFPVVVPINPPTGKTHLFILLLFAGFNYLFLLDELLTNDINSQESAVSSGVSGGSGGASSGEVQI
jgi:amino acid permease